MSKHIQILLVLAVMACTEKPQVQVIEIPGTRDIIPEGIAIDEAEDKLYLSSIHQQKLLEVDLSSFEARDYIQSGEFGYKRGIGIEIREQRLFALGSETVHDRSSSIFLVFDLQDDQLLHSFTFDDSSGYFMNDLAVSDEDQIYITDTEHHVVYVLDYPEGSLEVFLTHPQLQYPNGIAISRDQSKLFVDSWSDGVRIVDLATRQIINEKHAETTEFGIDGLKYLDGHLYAIRNGGDDANHGLVKLVLNADETDILRVEPILRNHPTMNLPTTFAISNGHFYLLANSQLRNLDQEVNQIIDTSKLANTYVLKVPLGATYTPAGEK